MVMRRLSVIGWPSGSAQDSEDCVRTTSLARLVCARTNQVCCQQVNFAKIEGVKCHVQKFPLDKVNEAYECMISGDARFRAVIVM